MNKETFKIYIKNLIKSIINNDFPGMASEMTYMFVIGVFPLMLLLMSIYGWLGKKTLLYPVLNVLSTIAPNDAINLLRKVLDEVMIFEHGGLMAIIGFSIVLGLSSNIFAVIMKVGKGQPMPFGPCLAIAGWVMLMFYQPVMNLFFNIINGG